MLLAGQSADASAFARLHAALEIFIAGSPLFEAVFAFSTNPEFPLQTGYLEPTVTDRLGLQDITLLALRPDGYIGLRSEHDHLTALERYLLSSRPGSKAKEMKRVYMNPNATTPLSPEALASASISDWSQLPTRSAIP